MARRRRRYAQDEQDGAPAHEGGALAHEGGASDEGLGGGAAQGGDLGEDRSCLTHPSHEASLSCARCKVAMCEVCAVTIHGRALCAECLGAELGGERRAGPWRGLGAAAAGLAAVGGVSLPLALGTQAAWMGGLPGGPTFFLYMGLAGGALAVGSGLVAQDFGGLGKRAGWVGVGLGLLALAAVLGVNALRVLGGAG